MTETHAAVQKGFWLITESRWGQPGPTRSVVIIADLGELDQTEAVRRACLSGIEHPGSQLFFENLSEAVDYQDFALGLLSSQDYERKLQ